MPSEAELWGDDDPDAGPPPGLDPALAALPPDLLAQRIDGYGAAAAVPACERVGPFAPPDVHGAGFARGGAADDVPPGMVLAGLAEAEWASPLCPGGRPGEPAWAGRLAQVSDDGLIGLMTAWRRLQSWAAAGEAAAVAELDRRRHAQVAAGADPRLALHVPDEIAIPLTLTTRAADSLHAFACRLTELPATMAALRAGRIDRPKAAVIVDALTGLDAAHAAAVEAAVIGEAPAQTTGQLRAALRRAILAIDPDALRARREEAKKDARVEVWEEPAGTAALAGRDLPAADVLAADQHLTALARHLRKTGAEGTLSQLRARAYLSLLLGSPLGTSTTPQAAGAPANSSPHDNRPRDRDLRGSSPHDNRPHDSRPPDRDPHDSRPHASGTPLITGFPAAPALAGSINLTMPLATWLGGTTGAGDVPGYGPISAEDAQQLARRMAAAPATRWCLTLTGPGGRALAHGCARHRATGASPDDWELTVTVKPLATAACSHQREEAGYVPSRSLRHLIQIRQPTCTAPGCRRPATMCDLDHTQPYDKGGRTCECNLAPLCRRHHQAKQVRGWRLTQAAPGTFTWQLPHGRTCGVRPGPYPPDPGPDGRPSTVPASRSGPDP